MALNWEDSDFLWNDNPHTWDDVQLIIRAAGDDYNQWENKDKDKLVKLILKLNGKTITESKRKQIKQYGTYIQVYVSTPLEECERRDVKRLYAKARSGVLKGFTGIDDPFEKPESSELNIDTTSISPEQAVQEVMLYLEQKGLVK